MSNFCIFSALLGWHHSCVGCDRVPTEIMAEVLKVGAEVLEVGAGSLLEWLGFPCCNLRMEC